MIFLPSWSSCEMLAIGHVCVHIKYVSTGKAYWLNASTFAWSDNGLDQMIDSLCKYVFAVASSTFLSSCLVFSKTPRNLQVGVMLFQALDRFKTSYLHILIRAEWRLQIKIFFFFLDLKISNRLWCIWVILLWIFSDRPHLRNYFIFKYLREVFDKTWWLGRLRNCGLCAGVKKVATSVE